MSERVANALRKMTPGALGGQSRAATPAWRQRRKIGQPTGTICMSKAVGYTTDSLFVSWPDCSVDGDPILAYHVYDHEFSSVSGDDRLTLFTTRGPEGSDGSYWQQQWFWGTRNATTGDNFYHSLDPGDPPVPGEVILVSYSSDKAGAFLPASPPNTGIANSVFTVRNYPDDYTATSQTIAVTATTLLIASAWGIGGEPTITLAPVVAPAVSMSTSIEDHHLVVSAYTITGSYSVTFQAVSRLYAVSTIDARYVV